MKPLWRWTIGPCLQQGLDILAESIRRTTVALGLDRWDWVICYNGLNRENLEFLRAAVGDRPIQFLPQDWSNCPIDDHCQQPRRKDGSFEWDGTRCGGTLWKVCPPRVRMETHEVVMDNDIILLREPPALAEFLGRDDVVVILEEPIKFYGRYDCLFPADGPYLNSGFMGFPPGYDFGESIRRAWIEHGRYLNLSQADEQGLLMYALSQQRSARVKADEIVELLHRDFRAKLTGAEYGVHLTQSNRIGSHYQWGKYKSLMGLT